MNNVLILSAGRRVDLTQAFQKEMAARELGGQILAVDLVPERSAACQVADGYLTAPRVTDPSYIDFLLEKCAERSIKLVIPTIDTELFLLAEHRDRFEESGIHVIISDGDLVQSCRDKRLTSKLFDDLEISTPRIYARNAIEFPCFAKPYDGSRSIGARVISCSAALTDDVLDDQKLIFMELIARQTPEFTVDIYFDRQGEVKSLVPRQRLEVRDGEVSKGVTRRNDVYDYLLPRVKKLKGARGCLTLQLFFDEKSKKFSALEINPRFGGGFPLSYSAGANYPGWLMDEYLMNKEVPFYDAWESDLLMLRYDAKVLVRGAR